MIERIEKLLKEKGKSKTQMMKELGFSTGLFSQWKRGLQKPSYSKLSAIASYLGTTVEYLETGENPVQSDISDNDLKFALFGGSEGVTDAMFDEVKQFAQFVKMRENSKKSSD